MIGFPNGYSTTAVKAFETEDALANGAKEIDMVINIGWLKDKRYKLIEDEIRSSSPYARIRCLKSSSRPAFSQMMRKSGCAIS